MKYRWHLIYCLDDDNIENISISTDNQFILSRVPWRRRKAPITAESYKLAMALFGRSFGRIARLLILRSPYRSIISFPFPADK